MLLGSGCQRGQSLLQPAKLPTCRRAHAPHLLEIMASRVGVMLPLMSTLGKRSSRLTGAAPSSSSSAAPVAAAPAAPAAAAALLPLAERTLRVGTTCVHHGRVERVHTSRRQSL